MAVAMKDKDEENYWEPFGFYTKEEADRALMNPRSKINRDLAYIFGALDQCKYYIIYLLFIFLYYISYINK